MHQQNDTIPFHNSYQFVISTKMKNKNTPPINQPKLIMSNTCLFNIGTQVTYLHAPFCQVNRFQRRQNCLRWRQTCPPQPHLCCKECGLWCLWPRVNIELKTSGYLKLTAFCKHVTLVFPKEEVSTLNV